jgi:hypothetical protein
VLQTNPLSAMNVIMLNVVMLSVIVLSLIMLSVIMLSLVPWLLACSAMITIKNHIGYYVAMASIAVIIFAVVFVNKTSPV